jgi:hypothetical protein
VNPLIEFFLFYQRKASEWNDPVKALLISILVNTLPPLIIPTSIQSHVDILSAKARFFNHEDALNPLSPQDWNQVSLSGKSLADQFKDGMFLQSRSLPLHRIRL